jgi:hypothetical protein
MIGPDVTLFTARLSVRLDGLDESIGPENELIRTEQDAFRPEDEESVRDAASTDVVRPDGSAVQGDWLIRQAVQPSYLRLERNGFTEPDELSVRFSFSDLPLDPRIIRAIHVELYAERPDLRRYSRAMQSGRDRPGVTLSPDNLLFVGYGVEPEIDFHEFSVTAMDYQQLLVEMEMPDDVRLPEGESQFARAIVEHVVKSSPVTRAIKVKAVGSAVTAVSEPSTEAELNAENRKRIEKFYRTAKRPDLYELSKPQKDHARETRWEYILRRCLNAAIIPVVWLDTIYLVPVGDIWTARPFGYQGKITSTMPDNAGAYADPEARAFTNEIPTFAIGANVDAPKFRRKLSRRSAPPIEVRIYQPGGVMLRESYPPEEWRKRHPERASMDGLESAPRVVTLPYSRPIAEQLPDIARTLFELHSRNGLEVSFSTDDVRSLHGPDGVPDVLWLVSGDAIRIMHKQTDGSETIDRGQITDEMTRLLSLSQDDLAEHLKERGFSAAVAGVLARSLKRGLPTEYKLRSMSVQSDANGVSIDIEAAEYMSVFLDDPRVTNQAEAGRTA